MFRPEFIAGFAGEMVAELLDLRKREAVAGGDHMIRVRAFDPDRAIGIDDDLVHILGGEQGAQFAQLMLRVTAAGEAGRGVDHTVHQNTRSRLTKMVRRSP